jgi:predicted Holliday junction resolvase-like endonuclease
MMWIAIIILALASYWFLKPKKEFKDNIFPDDAALVELGKVKEQLSTLQKENDNWRQLAYNTQSMYEQEKARNDTVISQKKSSETRLGQITENLVPFLEGFNHNPKDCHFLGQPIDLIAFDYDQGEITFIEVKTGNAQESKRQKIIKNIIKTGKVYYETIRVNQKGVVVKKAENLT